MSVNSNDMQSALQSQKFLQAVQQLMAQELAKRQKVSDIQDVDWTKASKDDLNKAFTSALDQQRQNQLNTQLMLANHLQESAARDPNMGQSVQPGSVYIPPNPVKVGLGIAAQAGALGTQASGQGTQAGIDANNASLPAMFTQLFQKKRNAASTLNPNGVDTTMDEDEEEDSQ